MLEFPSGPEGPSAQAVLEFLLALHDDKTARSFEAATNLGRRAGWTLGHEFLYGIGLVASSARNAGVSAETAAEIVVKAIEQGGIS